MVDLAVITPTRGRPLRFVELLEAVDRTARSAVRVIAAKDDDDPANYLDQLVGRVFRCDPIVYSGERKSLTGWTNHLALEVLRAPDPPRFLASLGDDHVPRTPGWDAKLIEAIEGIGGSGFAYGNDLLQGQRLPTAWVVSADIVRALGWMMLPTLAHMYVDNVTLEVSKAAEAIAYRPDVVIEHLHPVAGKASWDTSYRESNTGERYAADEAAFNAWREGEQWTADVETVRACVQAVRVP